MDFFSIVPGTLEQHGIGTAAPDLGPARERETRGRHFLRHRFLRGAVPAVAFGGLRSGDPVEQRSRLDVDHEVAAARAQRAKEIGIDRGRVGQMVVDHAAEHGIAAAFGEMRVRYGTADDLDVRQPRFVGRLPDVGDQPLVDLGCVDPAFGTDATRERQRILTLSRAHVRDTHPGLDLEPRNEALHLVGLRPVDEGQARQLRGRERGDADGHQCRNDNPSLQPPRHGRTRSLSPGFEVSRWNAEA